MLGGRENLSCDKPLQLYLIVFVVRVGLSLPLTIYQHLFVTNRRGRGRRARRENRVNNNDNDNTIPPEASSSAAAAATAGTTTTTTVETATDSHMEENSTTTTSQRPSTLVSGWAERYLDLRSLPTCTTKDIKTWFWDIPFL